MKKMKHIPALCLCLMLLCGAACAEEMHVLGRGNWDYLEYGCTLPDGRLVLTGEKTMNRPDHVTGAWLLCLNPDLTVSWEVVDEEENGYDSVRKAVVLPDGTIAVNDPGHVENSYWYCGVSFPLETIVGCMKDPSTAFTVFG